MKTATKVAGVVVVVGGMGAAAVALGLLSWWMVPVAVAGACIWTSVLK